jgi:hypothetical protein
MAGVVVAAPQAGREDEAMKEVFELIAQVLEDLLGNRGFVLPLHVAIIGANGTMMYAGYSMIEDPEGGLATEALAEHDVEGGIKVPINIVIVDAEGDAARIVLAPGCAPTVQILD